MFLLLGMEWHMLCAGIMLCYVILYAEVMLGLSRLHDCGILDAFHSVFGCCSFTVDTRVHGRSCATLHADSVCCSAACHQLPLQCMGVSKLQLVLLPVLQCSYSAAQQLLQLWAGVE